MNRPSRSAAVCFLAVLLTACQNSSTAGSNGALAPDGERNMFRTTFAGPTGSLPDGWVVGTTNPRTANPSTTVRADVRHARWQLTADAGAPTAPSTLALVDARDHQAQTFNLCWLPNLSLRDVDVEVAVRAIGGEEDQGGGPAWRIGSSSDYYVARWNPLEDNVRVYSVVGGERIQLDSARVRVDPDAWHTIRVRHVGDAITCWFDGEELLHASDSKLRAAGAVGLWTKADATTRFDDFVVRD